VISGLSLFTNYVRYEFTKVWVKSGLRDQPTLVKD
jgi:hypothetical protein